VNIIREVSEDDLHQELDKLFKARGAGHNFKLGALAMAHALTDPENSKLRQQLLVGMIHIQASVVTLATTEVSHLSQGLKEVLEVSDEDIQKAGSMVDKMYAEMRGSEPQE
jgi:hypothetical protein